MNRAFAKIILSVFFVMILTVGAAAPTIGALPPLVNSLGNLLLERSGEAMHAGSWDRQGHNGDARSIAAGQTLVLLHYHGAGIVRHFWCTFPGNTAIRSQLILRMYWDGQKHPSVRVPLGVFFGVGFGQQIVASECFDKSINLNWPYTVPQEFSEGRYDFKTEVYVVGKLFEDLLKENGIAQFKYLAILRDMCQRNPAKRVGSFRNVMQRIGTDQFVEVGFPEEETRVYRRFADALASCTKYNRLFG